MTSKRWVAALLACVPVLALLVTACSDNDGDTAVASPPAATASEAARTGTSGGSASTPAVAPPPARSTPDAARAFGDLRMLAGTIGPRASTTEGERRAAEYIRAQLEAAGYRASLESFDVQVPVDRSQLQLPPDVPPGQVLALIGSPNGTATGPLVSGGIGRPSDLGASARGAVVLLERGELTFAEKVKNAEAAGAVGVIIVNNETGLFRGDLGEAGGRLPAVAVAREDGASLREALPRSGRPVTLQVDVSRVGGKSQNVVGRPSEAPCTAYLGAHYDSVPMGPGANDNGSGTAMLIEVARARRLQGLCVVAFGSEEVGLLGSRAFVREHGVTGAQFMLNFDMVAKLARPVFVGDPVLGAQASDVASRLGHRIAGGSFGASTSSDHAAFIEAGVPAVTFHSGDDQFIHTGRDNMDNVSQADMAVFIDIAVALIDELMPA